LNFINKERKRNIGRKALPKKQISRVARLMRYLKRVMKDPIDKIDSLEVLLNASQSSKKA
jgi:hypothetical protein